MEGDGREGSGDRGAGQRVRRLAEDPGQVDERDHRRAEHVRRAPGARPAGTAPRSEPDGQTEEEPERHPEPGLVRVGDLRPRLQVQPASARADVGLEPVLVVQHGSQAIAEAVQPGALVGAVVERQELHLAGLPPPRPRAVRHREVHDARPRDGVGVLDGRSDDRPRSVVRAEERLRPVRGGEAVVLDEADDRRPRDPDPGSRRDAARCDFAVLDDPHALEAGPHRLPDAVLDGALRRNHDDQLDTVLDRLRREMADRPRDRVVVVVRHDDDRHGRLRQRAHAASMSA